MEALRCVTVNVRRPVPHLRSGHPDRWANRRPALGALLERERPHVLAVQEAVPDQVAAIAADLGERWTPVVSGRGRRDSGERVGLFVDTDRLTVLGHRTWALSRRPERLGSRSWGSFFPRIAVGAVIEDRETGIRFRAIATHLDPFSPLALRAGARLVTVLAGDERRWAGHDDERAVGVAGHDAGVPTDPDLPVVAMADWNAPQDSAVARILAAGGLHDTWDTAAERLVDGAASTGVGTYTAYRPLRAGGARLDRVLIGGASARRAVVDRAWTTTAVSTGGGGPVRFSDHAAVGASVRWEHA